MSVGIHELARQIEALRLMLESKFSAEFMGKINATLDLILKTLGDPQLQEQAKAALANINAILNSINQSNLIEKAAELTTKISNFVDNINKILGEIDPKVIANIVNNLNGFLDKLNEVKFIENISSALQGIGSFKQLVAVVADLSTPAKILMYGLTGAQIGVMLTGLLETLLTNKADSELKQLITVNKQQLSIQIAQLELTATDFLANREKNLHAYPELRYSDLLERKAVYYKKIVENSLEWNDSSLLCMQKAQEVGEELFVQMYQPMLDNEDITRYLDRIGKTVSNWGGLVEYTTYHSQWALGKLNKPTMSRDELSYSMVQRLYGKVVDSIMLGLVTKIGENGGNDLYYTLVNSFENAAFQFHETMRQIPQEKLGFTFPESPWSVNANQLTKYYHDETPLRIYKSQNNARWYIKVEWDCFDWEQQGISNPPELKPEVAEIIRARAYIEFCKQASPYFFAPYNMPREILNGVIDLPVGVWNVVRHPINTVTSIAWNFFTPAGWYSMGSNLWNHPTRMLTTSATTAGVATAGAFGISKLASSTPAATYTSMLASSPPVPVSSIVLVERAAGIGLVAPTAQRQAPLLPAAATGTAAEEKSCDKHTVLPIVPIVRNREWLTKYMVTLSTATTPEELYSIVTKWNAVEVVLSPSMPQTPAAVSKQLANHSMFATMESKGSDKPTMSQSPQMR